MAKDKKSNERPKGLLRATGVPTRDVDYRHWIGELKDRYRATQIKAAIAVNSALIEFYWNLGKDISEKYPGKVRDAAFFQKLSADLRLAIPDATGLSVSNIKYARYFFKLYSGIVYRRQVTDDKTVPKSYRPQVADDNVNLAYRPQVVDVKDGCSYLPQVVAELVRVPWGHHRTIIDKCHACPEKALFYVQRTIQNGWSRAVLLNWLSTDLYEREGEAQTNYALTMPSDDCDLARQLVKDPQVFEVFGLKEQYDETELKAAIVANIERTLLSLGHLVSFVGREYPVEIGGETKNIDLLFYIIPLHRYLVMEVKTTKYEPADLGQLSGYMAMAKHVLNTPGDNQPIGLLVCKDHNRVLAKIHLEELALPMGITDYELKKVLPTQAQLSKCYADAEAKCAKNSATPQAASESAPASHKRRKRARKGVRQIR